MSEDLTDEAKAAIAEAVRIVREDRFEAFVRGKVAPEPPKDGPPAPPAKPEPTTEPPKQKKGLWWGDALQEPSEPPRDGGQSDGK